MDIPEGAEEFIQHATNIIARGINAYPQVRIPITFVDFELLDYQWAWEGGQKTEEAILRIVRPSVNNDVLYRVKSKDGILHITAEPIGGSL